MISQIQLNLTTNADIKLGNYLAPLFQDVLMELIHTEYAQELHASGLHPYSQYVMKTQQGLRWVVSALDPCARSEMIGALADISLTELTVRRKDAKFHISGRALEEHSYDELVNRYYLDEPCSAYITVEFLTPTAFKSNGGYVIFPTAQLILNSLVKKFDSCSPSSKVGDELLSDYIAQNTAIVEYSLRSTKFPMEGITIPSFIGSVKLKCGGSREFRSLVNMLLKFGEYSGVGIKNSMGMGAVKIRENGGGKQ